MTTEVTDEVRAAVYDTDCGSRGHLPDLSRLVSGVPLEGETAAVDDFIGPDEGLFPHISCLRCGRAWIVIPVSGGDYAATLALVKGLLSKPDGLTPRKRPGRPPKGTTPSTTP